MFNNLSLDISKTSLSKYLKILVERNGSDIFISPNLHVKLKVSGNFENISEKPISTLDIQNILDEVLTEDQISEFESTLELNTALADESGERFRMNVYFHQRNLGIVIRHIKAKIPTVDDLGLPEIYRKLILEKRGLFLMIGATGSGKSTSLASMLEYRNQNGYGHVVTIEDPIEYVFKNKNCIFSQREVGVDTYSFGIALKNALRQAPDVLFIGELRDRETVESAITFAETGHLVVATLHASNTDHTFERILSLFSQDQHDKIVMSLSHTLNGIAGQRLVQGIDGKQKLAYEVLLNEGLITELIHEKKFKDIKEVINKNTDNHMMTFDECLFRLFKAGAIDKDTAIREADNQHNLRLKLSQYSSSNISQNAAASINTSIILEKDDF